MAGNAVIGALRVVLGADSAALQTGLKKAQTSLAAFGGGAKLALATAATAALGAGTAIIAGLKGAINEAEKLGEMAQSIGVPVEELSKLKFAAELSGVGIEQLGTAMGKFSRNMVNAAKGEVNDLTRSFAALGITVRDRATGELKSSTLVMSEVAEKFKGMEDGAAKTAMAIQLFGRAGATMIPMLNAGKDGMDEMMKTAKALGLVITKETALASDMFNDNLQTMGFAIKGIFLQILPRILPVLVTASEALVTFAKDTDAVTKLGTGIADFFLTIVMGIQRASLFVQRFAAEWAAFKTLMAAPNLDAMKAAFAAFVAEGDKTKIIYEGLAEDQRHFIEQLGIGFFTAAKITNKAAGVVAAGAENAVQSFLSSQTKKNASMIAEAQTVGLSTAAHEQLRIKLEAEAIAKEKNIPLTEALNEKIRQTGIAAGEASMKLQGARLTEEALLPWEKYNALLERNQQLLAGNHISLDTFGRLNRKAAEDAGADWGTAGASIAGSFKDIATSFGKSNSSMMKIAKAAGIVQGTISMFTGAAKALELPFPANLAAMATVLAKGAALVASIKGTQTPGFKTGGSFRVGGVGGMDSQMVRFMASPGELVDIRRPGQDEPRNAGGGEIALSLKGDVFSRDMLREMIERLNDMSQDNYRIKVAPA